MIFRLFFLLFIPAFIGQQVWAGPMDQVRSIEPSFLEIAEVTFRAEKLDWGQVDIWRKKMKEAPWLPTLYVGYDHSLKETASLSISDNISVSGNGVTVGPNENDFDQAVNSGDNLHFKAVWSLDNLVFHKDTFQSRREMGDLMKSRLTLHEHLFKVFSERRKLQKKYYGAGHRGGPLWDEIEMLTEKLDSHTKGVFAHRWVGARLNK